MKKTIYSITTLMLLLIGTMNTLPVKGNEMNTIERKIVEQIKPDGLCRWRTCTYHNGVLVSCTDWVYAYCPNME